MFRLCVREELADSAGTVEPVVTILIPWRPQPSRIAAFERVSEWYRSNLPGAEVRAVDSTDAVFNLSECRNVGIRGMADDAEPVIISDADTFPEVEPLLAALAAAATSGLVHLPYDEYHWLGATGTRQLADGVAPADCDFELVRGACSGVYVTTPSTWWRHGGQDERFRGWGFEDAAWYLAHQTLLGAPPVRHPGRVYAMHHVAESREGEQYDANAALMERYRGAAHEPGAMRQVVFGGAPGTSSADPESAANARTRPGV